MNEFPECWPCVPPESAPPLFPERNVRDRRCFPNPCPPHWLTGQAPPPARIASGMQSSRCGTGRGNRKGPRDQVGPEASTCQASASCPVTEPRTWAQPSGWNTHGHHQARLPLTFPLGKGADGLALPSPLA